MMTRSGQSNPWMMVGIRIFYERWVSDSSEVACTAADHWPTADLVTERTRMLYVPPGESELTTTDGAPIPRIRTRFGTFVPEYVKSYDVAQFMGCHFANSSVVEVGTATTAVILAWLNRIVVKLGERALT